MRKVGLAIMFAGLASLPGWASVPAHPGMLNYVEGQADIDGKTVTNKSVGNAEVEQGQVLETGKGKAEILLTPGVFLRLGNNSAVRMQNPGLANTSVELLHGEALVEATDIRKANDIEVIDHGTTTTLDKNGLYSFNADKPEVAVYDGKATLQEGDKREDLKKGREVDLPGLKTQKFNTRTGDELYRWSDLRSEYLSEASVSSARTYVGNSAGWLGGGWYFNPGYGYYSYLPGDGFLFSPFGWGFYGPRTVGYYGGFGRYYGGGYRASGPGRAVNGGAVSGLRASNTASSARAFSNSARPSGGFSGGMRGGRR